MKNTCEIISSSKYSSLDNGLVSTDGPAHHYTPLQFTQPDEANSLSKSTRHLLAPDPRYYYERTGSFGKAAQAVSYPAEFGQTPSKYKPGNHRNLFDINGMTQQHSY